MIKLCICALFLQSVFSKNSLNSGNISFNSASDVLGEASTDGAAVKGAITYALGSNGGYALKDDAVGIINFRALRNPLTLRNSRPNSTSPLQDPRRTPKNSPRLLTIMMDPLI